MKTGCVQNILLESEDFVATLLPGFPLLFHPAHYSLLSVFLQPSRCFYRAKSNIKSFLHSTLCHLASHCYKNIIFLKTAQQENQILTIAQLVQKSIF